MNGEQPGARDGQVLLVVDVQSAFPAPIRVLTEIRMLARRISSVATIEVHDESIVPFRRQLGMEPSQNGRIARGHDVVLSKNGYLPPAELVPQLKAMCATQVFVCGVQAETCVLAAGFTLFDAGLQPTLLPWLTVGSSLDRTGHLGATLWQQHFGHVITDSASLELTLEVAPEGIV